MRPEFNERDLTEILAGFRASRFARLDLRYETVRLAIDDGGAPCSAQASRREGDEGETATVSAGLLGTFRFAAGSTAASLASAQVEPETVIGTITVLDEVAEVKSGVRGTVSHIDVSEGAFVEYGQHLLRVRSDEAGEMRRAS